MINIFPANSQSFATNGLGTLPDAITCEVTEELNGAFELVLEYPTSGLHYNEIKMRRIILAKPNPYTTAQPFRIYSISKPINKIVTINACHLSYDLSGIPLDPFTAKSPTEAFKMLKDKSAIANPFTFNNTVTETGEINVVTPRSVRSVLGNNIQKAYPGEYTFDGYMVYYNPKRGYNRGFRVRYGNNLTDINQEENISHVCTGVYPYWYGELYNEQGEATEKVFMTLPEKIVKTPGTFDFEKVLPLDTGDEFMEQPKEDEMRKYVEKYIINEKLGVPEVSIDVSFVQLSKSTEYYNYTGAETVMLGDVVDVDFEEIGISADSRCIETVYDAIKDEYIKITLGEVASRITTTISEGNKDFENKLQDQKQKFDAVIGTIKIGMATIDQAIIGKADIDYLNANFAKLLEGHIDTAYIKEASIKNAHIDYLSADKITTGDLEADRIQAGVIQAINISADTAKINSAKIGNLSADKIQAGVIEAINISSDTATINSAKIGDLSADKITTGDIDADRMTTNSITAINANIGAATINSAKIGNLNADKITAGDITADRLKTNVISAVNASIGSATIDSAKIGNLDAGKITSGFIKADRIETGSISADKISTETINAIGVSASEITADKIASGEIKVGNANIVDGTISFAKITDVKIGNAEIDEALVVDAYIQNITADKIKGGILDAKEITVTNLRADSITVGKINGTQIGQGAISSGNLDELLNNKITTTASDVDKALKDLGIVKIDLSNTSSTANQALVKSEEAKNDVDAATLLANEAKTNATTAINTANTAKTDATTAINTANTAKTDATTAIGAATEADGKATSALQGASAANGEAYKANQAANAAYDKASTAESSASNAYNAAMGANGAANTAIGKANEAQKAADLAQSSASTALNNVYFVKDELDGLTLGVRNILKKSKVELTSSTYLVKQFRTTIDLKPSTVYTAVISGVVTGGQKFAIWMNGASNNVAYFPVNQDGVDYVTFTSPPAITSDDYKTLISIYNYPSSGATTNPATLNWITMFEGEVRPPKDWTPAPEDTDDAIASAIISADGKNKIFYMPSPPAISLGLTVGDTWFDTDDGNRIYRWDGTAWVTTKLGANAIENLAITNSHIANATIQNAKIANLDAGKITTGTLSADRIGALSITADKIAGKTITGDKITGNTITGGHIVGGTIQTGNLDAGIVTAEKIAAKAITADKMDVEKLFVGENAFINELKALEINANYITTGEIANERINLKGMISFDKFSEDIQHVFDVTGDKTYINGGMIAANTIKADKIDLLSGLSVQGPDKTTTFAITDKGNVEINGTLKSTEFDEGTSIGYQLTPDGVAILNQARISGEFVMPNAGITNFGATIGNENVLKIVDVVNRGAVDFVTEGFEVEFTTDSQYSGLVFLNLKDSMKLNTLYTLTFQVKKVSGLFQKLGGHVDPELLLTKFTIDGIDTAFGTPPERLILDDGEYHDVFIQVTRVAEHDNDGTGTNNRLSIQPNRGITTTVRARFKDIKMEEGDVKSPWCPSKNEQTDFVRIWAGSDYENRDKAPFKVTQKGDVSATNATLSGRLVGNYDNDLIHIHNNQIVINDTLTYMDPTTHEVYEVCPMDFSPTAHVILDKDQSILNNNVTFGSIDDPRMIYTNDGRLITLNDCTVASVKGNGSITISPTENPTGAVEHVVLTGKGGGMHSIGYSDANAGLQVVSKGGATHTSGKMHDFILTGEGGRAGKVNALVDGGITIKENIQSTNHNIEMRSISDQGWGFYAT